MINFFKIEQNPLSKSWCIFSEFEQLSLHFFSFDNKKDALKYLEILNNRANEDAKKYNINIKFPKKN